MNPNYFTTYARAKAMLALVMLWATDCILVFDPEFSSGQGNGGGEMDPVFGAYILPVPTNTADATMGAYCLYGHVNSNMCAINPALSWNSPPNQTLPFLQNVASQDMEANENGGFNAGLPGGTNLVAVPLSGQAEIHWAAQPFNMKQVAPQPPVAGANPNPPAVGPYPVRPNPNQ